MKNNAFVLPIVFVVASGLVFSLGTYLLATKTTLHPQLFITACGEVLKDIRQHVHFNPEGALSSLILFVAATGLSLTVFQLIKFIVSHRRLANKLSDKTKLPKKLKQIINTHNLGHVSFSFVDGKPTAYTIGVFHPQIVLSLSLVNQLSDKQLEAVVLHEYYHLRNRHLLWSLLSRLISSMFFFIPLIDYLARQLKTEFELTADSFVVDTQKSRAYLCGSMALNLQYAGDFVPHFSSSPIEKRVESLLSQKVSLDKISSLRLGLSVLSVSVMVGLAITQPSQIIAGFHNEPEAICRVGQKCQNKDCSDNLITEADFFTPSMPASFSLSSSH